MRGIKTKGENKWKKIGLFLILLLAFALLLNSVGKVYKKKKEAEKALVQMKEQTAALGEREKLLKESLERLETEEGLEFEMRKKLNVAEAGESVAIIVEEKQAVPNENSTVSAWQKIKVFFVSFFR